MKIKILKVYEQGNLLRVETECPYGKDNLGLSLDSKYLDFDDVPRWKKEVKKLLELKYGVEVRRKKNRFKKDCKEYSSLEDLVK